MVIDSTNGAFQGAFQGALSAADLYRHLERRLKAADWDGGAAEAHGVLSAFACLGIDEARLKSRVNLSDLFRLSESTDIDLLEGLYALIRRDLQADGFEFRPLLADADCSCGERIESLAQWCGGFVHGFLHDDAKRLDGVSEAVRESVDDMIQISGVNCEVEAGEPDQAEKQLVEIEEYLRVATQLIFEEMNPPQQSGIASTKTRGVN